MSNQRVSQAKVIWVFIILGYLFVWSIPFVTSYGPERGYGTKEAESLIRDPRQFQWYTVPMLVIVLYFYFGQLQMENYSTVLSGLAFFLFDLFNEIWNSVWYRLSGNYACPWMCKYKGTAYQVLIGWNVEIVVNFLICGLMSTFLLSKNKEKSYFGGKLNNRHFWAIVLSFVAVSVEIVLNYFDALIWNFKWWNTKFPWLIVLNGYLPFFEISYLVYDSPRKTQLWIVGGMAMVLGTLFVVLMIGGVI